MIQLVLLGLILSQAGPSSTGYPPPDEFARKVRQALTLGFEEQSDFTFIERRRDVDISILGKVTVGPLRTFEVYPSREPGGTYKRLIAIDGRPLTDKELAERDAEHQRNLREAAARVRSETPRQRAARLRKESEERREREAVLDDAVNVFQPTFRGRELVEGEPVLVVDLRPRPDAAPKTREGRWMQHFEGRIWVAESGYQIVKLDMRAFSDIAIGWGVIGRINKGSRVMFSRRRFEDVWLPAELTYEASGRTLLVRPFEFAVTTTYSDYKRLRAARRIARPGSPRGRQERWSRRSKPAGRHGRLHC